MLLGVLVVCFYLFGVLPFLFKWILWFGVCLFWSWLILCFWGGGMMMGEVGSAAGWSALIASRDSGGHCETGFKSHIGFLD